MSIRIGINGAAGRMGKAVLEYCVGRGYEVALVNASRTPSELIYGLQHDSVYGFWGEGGISPSRDGYITVNGKEVRLTSFREPREIPWGKHGVDLVIECTGKFPSFEKASQHLDGGAKMVVISCPAEDSNSPKIPTFIHGVNSNNLWEFSPGDTKIISGGSCTTTALTPALQVLLSEFGIECAMATTVHAVTSSQNILDGFNKKQPRMGRSGMGNIIPATSGAAKTVARVLPGLAGKILVNAYRVPVLTGSVVNLVLQFAKKASYEDVCLAMKNASETTHKGTILYTTEDIVSTDIIGCPYASIFDAKAGMALPDGGLVSIALWYDNERGYAANLGRLLEDVMKWMQKKNL